ncbi:helix-turn-helix transcriptional regulator [Nocardia sp. CA-119907]|uniref:helix-turn-helix transcriptional regulator n=1 Tax=Nocardia sp. CA-119907 TaxID=3239973 RepID=UPI003D99F84A
MSDERVWLTRDELGERWRIKPKTLANWAASVPLKGPRFVKVGGYVRYALADVVAYEDALLAEAA